MNNSKKLLSFAQIALRQARRQASSNAPEVVNPRFSALKEAQKKFQTPDSTPVYAKGGVFDTVLYGTTVAIVTVALGLAGETLWNVTFPKTD